MKITDYTLHGASIPIDVDAAGAFRATYLEEDYKALTLEGLTAQLVAAAKAQIAELAIPVTVLGLVPTHRDKHQYGKIEPYEPGTGVINATLRGKHARLGSWMLTSVEGKKFQINGYEGKRVICRRLTPEEIAEYHHLTTVRDEAVQAVTFWEADRLYDLDTLDPKKGSPR